MIEVVQLKEITEFLDGFLDIKGIKDSSVNGLQVGKDRDIQRVGFAVDAAVETFEKARDNHCDMLIVHHGLFWKKNETITGFMYDRMKILLDSSIALYAAHLPLDKHAHIGNNSQLATTLGLRNIRPLGDIGMSAEFEYGKELDTFIRDIKEKLNAKITALPFGPTNTRKVGFCSGGGMWNIYDAIREGCDTFVTGDSSHSIVHIAKESGINVIFAGHYATETLGVKALAAELKQKFNVEVGFIDVPTGL